MWGGDFGEDGPQLLHTDENKAIIGITCSDSAIFYLTSEGEVIRNHSYLLNICTFPMTYLSIFI